jgi:hypothetical protein
MQLGVVAGVPRLAVREVPEADAADLGDGTERLPRFPDLRPML